MILRLIHGHKKLTFQDIQDVMQLDFLLVIKDTSAWAVVNMASTAIFGNGIKQQIHGAKKLILVIRPAVMLQPLQLEIKDMCVQVTPAMVVFGMICGNGTNQQMPGFKSRVSLIQ